MKFTTEEYFATYDEALEQLTHTVETQQAIIEALFGAVNEGRMEAGKLPLQWKDLIGDNDGVV